MPAGAPGGQIAGILLLIFLSSGLVGVLLGFLFAVPRSIEDDAESRKGRSLLTNTNLSKVSDWLTTMLVGVGLTQLHAIDDYLGRFQNFLAAAVSAAGVTGAGAAWIPFAGPMMLVFAACCGFILMYMHTRMNLVLLLKKVEDALLLQSVPGNAVKNVARELTGGAAAVASHTDVSVGDALSVMFEALYEPDGYKKVIALRSYLEGTPVGSEGEFWFYLAAAYGQQYNYATSDADKVAARSKAMDAAQRAIKRDSSYKARLWLISDPAGSDGDLAAFREDAEFRALVGK